MPHGAVNLKGKGLGDGKKQYEYEKKQICEMLKEYARFYCDKQKVICAAHVPGDIRSVNTTEISMKVLNAPLPEIN